MTTILNLLKRIFSYQIKIAVDPDAKTLRIIKAPDNDAWYASWIGAEVPVLRIAYNVNCFGSKKKEDLYVVGAGYEEETYYVSPQDCIVIK